MIWFRDLNPSLNPYEQLEPQTLLSTGVLDSGDPSNPSFSVVSNRWKHTKFRMFPAFLFSLLFWVTMGNQQFSTGYPLLCVPNFSKSPE